MRTCSLLFLALNSTPNIDCHFFSFYYWIQINVYPKHNCDVLVWSHYIFILGKMTLNCMLPLCSLREQLIHWFKFYLKSQKYPLSLNSSITFRVDLALDKNKNPKGGKSAHRLVIFFLEMIIYLLIYCPHINTVVLKRWNSRPFENWWIDTFRKVLTYGFFAVSSQSKLLMIKGSPFPRLLFFSLNSPCQTAHRLCFEILHSCLWEIRCWFL